MGAHRIRFHIETRNSDGKVVATFGATSRWKAFLYLLGIH